MIRTKAGQYLKFEFYSNLAVTITGNGRHKADAELDEHTFGLSLVLAATPNTVQTTYVAMPEGELWDCILRSSTANFLQEGLVFCVCSLVSTNDTTNQIYLQTLFSGYVTSRKYLGYPFSGIKSTQDTTGAVMQNTVANPSAGAGATISMTAGLLQRITGLRFQLTTDTNPGNRIVVARWNLNAAVQGFYTIASPNPAHGASTTKRYQFTPNYPAETQRSYDGTNDAILLPMPKEFYLQGNIANSSIVISVLAMGVGDQISVLKYTSIERIMES